MDGKNVEGGPINPAHKTATNDNHKGNFGVEIVNEADYLVNSVNEY